MRPVLTCLLCCLIALAQPVQADRLPLPTVSSVDVARYAGPWYEIALLPNRFQRQCVSDTQARYSLDGERLEVINRCRKADGEIARVKGHAKVVADSGNAKLRVSFFWPFYGDYWILDLDPDYRHVLVGEPGRQYAWILARESQIAPEQLERLLVRAAELGFDRSRFRFTTQGRPLD